MNVKTDEAICKLLKSLFQAFIITISQMRKVAMKKPSHCAFITRAFF